MVVVIESHVDDVCNKCKKMGMRFNFRVKTAKGDEVFTVFLCPHMNEESKIELSGDIWKIEDYRKLFGLIEEGVTVGMIADKMGRTRKGIERKLERLREKTRYLKQLPYNRVDKWFS